MVPTLEVIQKALAVSPYLFDLYILYLFDLLLFHSKGAAESEPGLGHTSQALQRPQRKDLQNGRAREAPLQRAKV